MLEQYQEHQPHLLIYGEPSSGKHRSVKEFLHKKYQPHAHYKHAVYWLSCIHPEVQQELSTKVKDIGTMLYRPWSKDSPKHCVIVLDGIEYIPYTVQASLRRCIELFSEHTRFILIGNTYDTLMKPIQSRFVMIQFTHTNNQNVKTIMKSFGKRVPVQNEVSISFSQEFPVDRKEDYHCIHSQLVWLVSFHKQCMSTDCMTMARQWVSHGWSMIDLVALLVYETQLWIAQYDKTISKKCFQVWKKFPQKERYALWRSWNTLYKGQTYELFWVYWMLTEIRVWYMEHV